VGPGSGEGDDPWGSMAADEDTIAAVATPVVPQEGGVAIVRLSGSNSVDIVRRLFIPSGQGKARGDWQPESHKVVHGCMLGATRDEVLDEVRSCFGKRSVLSRCRSSKANMVGLP
jgi:tRNA U34 5-carboxymethylaminomethyl modifying GTPase MnmE/TrmE